MARFLAVVFVALSLGAGPVCAEPDDLWRALRLEALIGIMADEGRAYGTRIADDLFAGGGGPSWQSHVEGLYDEERMTAEIRKAFDRHMAEVDTAPLVAFFTTPRGRKIVSSEIAARRAFLASEVEAAAHLRADALEAADPARHALINEFISANDLVEFNVASSLTFTYAFNMGLVAGGAFDGAMSEEEALANVWAQEAEVREDTRRWLTAQLTLAFAPLSDADLRAYTDLSRTAEGAALNAAFFTAFEPTFTRVAQGLGEGVARFMGGRDI